MRCTTSCRLGTTALSRLRRFLLQFRHASSESLLERYHLCYVKGWQATPHPEISPSFAETGLAKSFSVPVPSHRRRSCRRCGNARWFGRPLGRNLRSSGGSSQRKCKHGLQYRDSEIGLLLLRLPIPTSLVLRSATVQTD